MSDLIVFLIGASGYSILEILWRGYTHWTMAFTGGICMLFLYMIAVKIHMPLIFKCFLGSAVITAVELLVGSVVNLSLHWNVWDYSALPFNFKGQICLFYSVMWFFLCIPVIFFCSIIHR